MSLGSGESLRWIFSEIIVLKNDDVDFNLTVTYKKHNLNLDSGFLLGLVATINEFADEVFSQKFDDVGLGNYRLRIYIDRTYAIIGLLQVGDDIPVGSKSILSEEFQTLATNVSQYLRENNVLSMSDVTFSVKEDLLDILRWSNYKGLVPITDSSNYDDWIISHVLITEHGLPVVNLNLEHFEGEGDDEILGLLVAGFFTALQHISLYIEDAGIDEIILEKYRIYLKPYKNRIYSVIFAVKDNIPLPRNSLIYKSASKFLLILQQTIDLLESRDLLHDLDTTSQEIAELVKEAHHEGMLN